MRDGDVLLADDREANKAWCVDRQELFLYLASQLLQDKHTWTFRPGLQERDFCTLLLTKFILGLRGWIRAGEKGVGDVRPAFLFPLVKKKRFLDSGVRRCCRTGQSCMRRVIDCSSVPHTMAWRSVARAIRTVARLGGTECEIFDISQLRYELDSTFQELNTPPSRCCWRCGCAMSCVSLITADIDQAFEACSASAKTSLSLLSPGSRQIPSWFARVVVSYASLGDLSHLVAGGFRFQLLSWPGRYSASRRSRWSCWGPWCGRFGAFQLVGS